MELLEYVKSTYGIPDNAMKNHLDQQKPTTWCEFLMSVFLFYDKETPKMTVSMSTTYGICKEVMGFEMSEDEQEYISERGGIWNVNMSNLIINPMDYIFTFRQVINDLQQKYPE